MKELNDLLDAFVAAAREVFKDNLRGAYLHGSAVMGCFRPEKSDVDLLVIVEDALSDGTRRAFLERVVALNDEAPPKGIEMSVVRRAVCDPFVYPTPYELHFSVGHLEWYQEDPEEYIRELRGVDWDLAAHFTILRARGRCLYGLPVEAVFGAVPREDYLDSIRRDVAEAGEEITEYPLYLSLNLARVLAFCEEGLVLSKKEGGEWALGRVPAEFRPLLRAALDEYTRDVPADYDPTFCRRYADYMLARIFQS